MKTAKEILAKRISVFPSEGDMTDEAIKQNVYAAMEEYRKEGRFFTEDEICKIQSTAYDEGYAAGLDEAGC